MEEVQSWWEVPAVAHFCYVFRSAFNLIFFEIAELESALLDIQDPDMSISLDQLIIRLLQGCYDENSINEENWEEKLHELFSENYEDNENPLDDSQHFFQLTPRLKIVILHRLCELRLDVEGALDAIKNIPSEEMQAKCMGKDCQNNTYWYFCDERLYKEDTSSRKKGNQISKKQEVKSAPNKNNRQTALREKRKKASVDLDKSWTVACWTVSDWEKLKTTFSKSKNSQEKKLVEAIQNHLPILQERVSEKDRLLRKRFLELAPKRTSSRISRVQEKKKMEELKAQEEARRARLEAEKEEAKREALRLKIEKESRQKRAEMRHKAVEERAKRAQFRERIRDVESEDSYDDSDNDSDEDNSANEKIQREKRVNPRVQRRQKKQSEESEYSSSSEKSESENKVSNVGRQRTNKRREIKQYCNATTEQSDNDKRYLRTYSNFKTESKNDQIRVSSRLQNKPKTVKYRFDTDESEQESDESPSSDDKNKDNIRLLQNRQDDVQFDTDESDDENASDGSQDDESSESDKNLHSKSEDSLSVQNNSFTLPDNFSNRSRDTNISLPRVAMYKATLLQNSSDVSKWNAALDSKGQKLHILNDTYDNLSSKNKKLKLEQGKNFRTASPNLKSSVSKENHIYQTPFITYGKTIPSSPAIVRLDFRKPPNHQVSS